MNGLNSWLMHIFNFRASVGDFVYYPRSRTKPSRNWKKSQKKIRRERRQRGNWK